MSRGRAPRAAVTGQAYRDQFERNFQDIPGNLSDQLLVDVTISAGEQKKTEPRGEGGEEGRWRGSVSN